MKIRKYKKADQEQVYTLIHDILVTEFNVESTAYKMDDLKDIAAVYKKKKEIFLVAEIDERIIGTVAIKEEDKNVALLRRLFVAPDQRGKGHGLALIKRALEFCHNNGYKKVLFQGTTSMHRALGLCERAGFMRKEVIELGNFHLYRYEKLLRGTKKEIFKFLTQR